jgi:exodeoxyribonuclease VII large subunit
VAGVRYDGVVRDRDRDQTLPLDFSVKPTSAPAPPAPAPAPAPPQLPSAPASSKPPPKPVPPEAPRPRALSVAELDRAIKGSLEANFDRPVWVEGEVSGARPVSSGHLYFSLKDEKEDATIDVAMYKTNITPRARALVKDGARVRLRGRPTFWAPRGKLQFIADRADAVGRGALLEALEKLKEKLSAEGLFAPERKRPLPADPRTIGVVSSAGGAVIHDIYRVAFRRGGASVLLSAATVQGDGAPESIRRALARLERVWDVDVIIIARGGGSADELMAFNDEDVVRAVAGCRVPVVSAVGHEVDVTLLDFAADARAATPSQAAEMVVPDGAARLSLLAERRARLLRAMRARLAEEREVLGRLGRKLGDPRLAIASSQQLLDDRALRLDAAVSRAIASRREHEHAVSARLYAEHPRAVLARERVAMARVHDRLAAAAQASLARRISTAHAMAGRLDALSPLKVLGRGYAIATREGGHAIRAATDVKPGDRIAVRVAEGQFDADVVEGRDPVTGKPA